MSGRALLHIVGIALYFAIYTSTVYPATINLNCGQGVPVVTGPGLGGGSIGVNNTTHVVTISENFDFSKYVDKMFCITNDNNIISYRFNIVATNETGEPWSDFHFEILGSTTPYVFTPSPPLPGPPTFGSNKFTTCGLTSGNKDIDCAGVAIADQEQVQFFFNIAVSDMQSFNNFVIRNIPSTPEPATAALLGASLLVIFVARFHRKRQRI